MEQLTLKGWVVAYVIGDETRLIAGIENEAEASIMTAKIKMSHGDVLYIGEARYLLERLLEGDL